jgi:hypothetical protein
MGCVVIIQPDPADRKRLFDLCRSRSDIPFVRRTNPAVAAPETTPERH